MKHYGFEWWTSMYLYQNRMVLHTKCFPTQNVFQNNNRWKRRRRCWCCWLFFSSRFQSTEISFSLHLNVSFLRRLLVHVVIAMTNIDRVKWYGAQHTYLRVSFHQNLLISLCGSAIYFYIYEFTLSALETTSISTPMPLSFEYCVVYIRNLFQKWNSFITSSGQHWVGADECCFFLFGGARKAFCIL